MQTRRLVIYFLNVWSLCSISHYRFVLYQLSKNLNRPFFMDFLTKLSEERPELADDDEEPLLGGCKLVEARWENDKLLSQMHRIIHQPPGQGIAPLCQEEDTGDTFLEMILQPSVMDEVDGRKQNGKADEVKPKADP